MPIRINADKSQIEEYKDLCKDSLYFLCKRVLGYDDWDDVHTELEIFMKKAALRKLILLPRGHLKSSIVTKGYTIQRILCNPNVRVLIANEVWDNARKMLFEIKELLTTKSDLPHFFGRFDTFRWNADEIVVRQREKALSAPTVGTTGVEAEVTSLHYDCLHPDTKVYTSNGYFAAKAIKTGTRVLGSDGKFHSVEKTAAKRSDKPMIGLRAQYQTDVNWFTEDHPVLSYADGSMKWVGAGDLRSGDFVCVPVSGGLNRQPSRTNTRINDLMQENDVWRLIGYWLAEGCHTKSPGVRLSFGYKEGHYVDDVRRIVKTHFGRDISVSPTKSNTLVVYFTDADCAEILNKFGTHSYNKHLPPLVLNNAGQKQRELVTGYFRGDGCESGNAVNFTSVSHNLLSGVQLVLAKNRISSGIAKLRSEGTATVVGNVCRQRAAYSLTSTHPMLKLFVGTNHMAWNTKPFRSFFTDKYWVVPLVEVLKDKALDRDVIDLQVADTHDFYCPGMIVHNCIIADDLQGVQNCQTK